jgi:hypothetical protein
VGTGLADGIEFSMLGALGPKGYNGIIELLGSSSNNNLIRSGSWILEEFSLLGPNRCIIELLGQFQPGVSLRCFQNCHVM